MKTNGLLPILLAGTAFWAGLAGMGAAHAGDWSISLWGGAPFVYSQPAPDYYYSQGGYDYDTDYDYGYGSGYGSAYTPGWDYYPTYVPRNPVVRRDAHGSGGYAPDGTYHSEDTVEDRHSSYYSPGRNEAITRPNTTVDSWNYGPGMNRTRERTSWIGADGRPHSTTINRTQAVDPWGNTHTDTQVDLKKVKSSPPGGTVSPPPLPGRTKGPSSGVLPLMPRNKAKDMSPIPKKSPTTKTDTDSNSQIESPSAGPAASR